MDDKQRIQNYTNDEEAIILDFGFLSIKTFQAYFAHC